MKKTLSLIAMALCFVACSKIEKPYLSTSQQEGVDVIFPELDYGTVYRKTLFDEYTGHKCSNCPDGHAIVEQMSERFGDTLVVVGIHANFFAEPETGVFSYDFRTEAGEQLYIDYHITNNPQAIINRSGGPINKDVWFNGVQNADRSVLAAIQIINQYDENTNKLKVNTKTTFLEDYDQPVQLSLLLIEDNIYKPQQSGAQIVDDYIHNHVLRAGINGTYGEYISTGGMVEKYEDYYYGYSIDFTNHDWIPVNCSVVAILLDAASRKVLQVEKVKVK